MSEYRGELYRTGDMVRRWRWRIIAANGRIVDASSQGFVRRQYAKKKLFAAAAQYDLVRFVQVSANGERSLMRVQS